MTKNGDRILSAHLLAFIVGLIDIVTILQHANNFLLNDSLDLIFKVSAVLFNFYINVFLFTLLLFLIQIDKKIVQVISYVLINSLFMLYVISWFVFDNLGVFLNLEGLRLSFINPYQIFLHIKQVNPAQLTYLAIIVFMALIFFFPIFKKICLTLLNSQTTNKISRKLTPLLSGIFASFILLACVFHIFTDATFISIVKNKLSVSSSLVSEFITFKRYDKKVKHTDALIVWNKQNTLYENDTPSDPLNTKNPVIVLVIESLRSDVLKDNHVMPNVFQLAQESIFFPNSYSTSSHSDYADPSIFSSHFPLRTTKHHYYPSKLWYPRVLIYDVLKNNGYATSIFSAQNEDWGNMRHYLQSDHLDIYFDAKSAKDNLYINKENETFASWATKNNQAGKLDDAVVVDETLAWILKNKSAPFFTYLNFQRSHFPYTWPDNYTPRFAPHEITFKTTFANYPKSKVSIMKNRYFNALAYIDQQVGRLIQSLKEERLYDDSIIIITGDTGQAFYEKDVAAHAADLNNEVAVVPIIIKTPQNKFKFIKEDFVQHIDIVPTICQLLNIEPPAAFQGSSIFETHTSKSKPIFLTAQSALATQDAIILQGWKFIKDYRNNQEYLFNLNNDFNENKNLIHKQPDIAKILRQQLSTWREMQLKFYSNKTLLKEYYPPKYFYTGKPIKQLVE